MPREDGFLRPALVEALESVSDVVPGIGGAFVANLKGTISTLCVPVTLAMASAQQWRFRQLSIAEHIRSGADPDANPDDPALIRARKQAKDKWEAEARSTVGIDHMADSACEFLLSLHEQESVRIAAKELLRQGTALLWSAFEILSRDLFACLVNSDPMLGKLLLESPDGRRVFQLKALELDTLASYGFNISSSLGSILVSRQDLSDLRTIKCVYGLLFPENAEVREALATRELWMLAQRRHLIVHNRGIVDQRYLDNTGDRVAVGDELQLDPNVVEQYAFVMQTAAAAMVAAVGNKLK